MQAVHLARLPSPNRFSLLTRMGVILFHCLAFISALSAPTTLLAPAPPQRMCEVSIWAKEMTPVPVPTYWQLDEVTTPTQIMPLTKLVSAKV